MKTLLATILVSFNLFADIVMPNEMPKLSTENLFSSPSPKLSVSNEANTGIYWDDKHNISFAKNGANVFTLKSDGTLEFKNAKLNKEETNFVFMAVVKYLTQNGLCK